MSELVKKLKLVKGDDCVFSYAEEMPNVISLKAGRFYIARIWPTSPNFEEYAAEFVRRWNAISTIKGILGNVDHSKGNGANAAKYRGNLLNDIRKIVKAESE